MWGHIGIGQRYTDALTDDRKGGTAPLAGSEISILLKDARCDLLPLVSLASLNDSVITKCETFSSYASSYRSLVGFFFFGFFFEAQQPCLIPAMMLSFSFPEIVDFLCQRGDEGVGRWGLTEKKQCILVLLV